MSFSRNSFQTLFLLFLVWSLSSACQPQSTSKSSTGRKSYPMMSTDGSGSGAASGGGLVQDGTLIGRVRALENRIETSFQKSGTAGGVPNQLYIEGEDLSRATYFDGADSALFTGIYLASQCLKLSSSDPFDRESALRRTKALLDTAEIYHRVTGVPGLIARYVYERGSSDFPAQEVDDKGKPRRYSGTLDWSPGAKGFEKYRFCGLTSRDQYHGFILGLAACHHKTNVQEIRSRSAELLVSIIDKISKAGWKIPYGPYEMIWSDFNARGISSVSKLFMASAALQAIPTVSQAADAPRRIELAALTARLEKELSSEYDRMALLTLVEQGWWNSYAEYYAYNLSSLAYLGIAWSETDQRRLEIVRTHFWNQFWLNTWTHKNTQFTFVSRALLGGGFSGLVPRSKPMPDGLLAWNEGRESLNALLSKRRSDLEVSPVDTACVADDLAPKTLEFIEVLVKKIPIPELKNELNRWGKIKRGKCDRALALAARGYEHYYWENNPFVVDSDPGEGKSVSPAVDAIFAYWLGRSVDAFSERE